RDLGVAYAARVSGRAPEWDALPVRYADYTVWQRKLLAGGPGSLLERQLDYWRETLAGLPEELALPFDRPRPVAASYEGGVVDFRLPADLHERLVGVARESRATLFMVLQTGLAVTLSRLGAGMDVPLGTPVAGRGDEALDGLVGFFVNTLVLRTDLSGDPSFRELLDRVREADLAAFAHQDLPFDRLVEELNPTRSAARHPLFQVLFALQNTAEARLDLPGLETRALPVSTGAAKFDLQVEMFEEATDDGRCAGVAGRLEYARDLFDHSTVELLARRLVLVLEALAEDLDRAVDSVGVVLPEERHHTLVEWNDTTAHYPADRGVHELFEERAAATPDAVALVFGDEEVTYAELDARAN
ncbi:non-ribosomal peptide synthetase, partial [Streptomyces sp. JJ66]|uniref:condensation domain-containing protein n=1 Tax=Streptomyces sp. JJ66 TaxID=2803843 RepID=UPI001C5C3782